MSGCPFGYGGVRAAQAMETAQAARLGAAPATDAALQQTNPHAHHVAAAASSSSAASASSSNSSRSSPTNGLDEAATLSSPPQAPLGMWTGGLRTSLGVENAHPLSVWMKEMQARGGLKGVDIEKELLGFNLVSTTPEAGEAGVHITSLSGSTTPSLEDAAASASLAEREKNWKQKRDHPPINPAAARNNTISLDTSSSNGNTEPSSPLSSPTHPTQLHLYPGMFSGRINHNIHTGQSPMTKYDQEVTYWNYIHPEVLCSLQNGRQGKGLNHHDEHLFILVHQVFELWFKQILWELEYVRNCLIGYRDPLLPQHPVERNPLARCVQRLNRADTIMRLATEGYSIMETMDPSDFLEFRDFLSPSSGFQSVQLREMEILLGLKDEERIPCAGRHYREAFMANGENKTGVFDRRLKKEKTLKEGLYIFLKRSTPSKRLDQFMEAYFHVLHTQNTEKSKDFEEELTLLEKMLHRTSDEREKKYLNDLVEKAKFGKTLAVNSSQDVAKFFSDPIYGQQRSSILFLFTYHSHPELKEMAELVNGFLKFEQGVLLWRQRHARMVETFIGRRPGTGGSSGVEYIDQTAAQYRIFTDIWRIRSLCVARSKINFDPDAEEGVSAIYQGKFMESLRTDYTQVRAEMEADQQLAMEKAAAAAASDGASSNGAAGAVAAASNSIAAGIGPGVATGQTA